jgi:mannose/cellobiose epimerase-like protein (N-acyl-D-glucosamine 2-epimerase family)
MGGGVMRRCGVVLLLALVLTTGAQLPAAHLGSPLRNLGEDAAVKKRATKAGAYRFEESTWWLNQLEQLARFYYRAHFGDGPPDYRRFHTDLRADGRPVGNGRQEAATISRLVYGMATSYLLTGEDRYRVAALAGAEYLRTYFRQTEGRGYWWAHARDTATSRILLESTFPDDRGTIPLYEQIYDLAGLAQTYRISGDARILSDLRGTQAFMEDHYQDPAHGGYFSHIDPHSLRADDPRLGPNQLRKNWNSIGDHAPAYLINLYLATGDTSDRERLRSLGRLIATRFPDPLHSPFVNERFLADWTPDHSWGWQKNRAIVGHNLKIAWTLARLSALGDSSFLKTAQEVADRTTAAGRDPVRGGWYDCVQRQPANGRHPTFVWHDRKIWWQQEQGILGFYLLAGLTANARSLELARETATFYNRYFLDHEHGGVRTTVLATGEPYTRGKDGWKGAHWISGYHTFELCYLATVYTRLLQRGSLDLYFHSSGGILKVAPDLLPPGSLKVRSLWMGGVPLPTPHPESLTVTLPKLAHPVKVRVQLEFSAKD